MRLLPASLVCLLLLTACVGVGQKGDHISVIGRHAQDVVSGARANNGAGSQDLGHSIARQLQELEGREQQVPVTLNEDVKEAVAYFLTDARMFMTRSLSRSHRYLPIMKRIFRERGLPPDLVYLALIESGYRVDAVSPASAVGPWQFIRSTGQRYDLAINDFVDERMDPIKSTKAAAAYLSDLHDIFGCWHLAAAGYNAGEGTVLRALKGDKSKDFWDISKGRHLRAETKGYVPKFLAALLIAKDPAHYGLSGVEPEPLLTYDEVTLPQPTDIAVIARLAGISEEEVRAYNPHLKLWCTPLDQPTYTVYLPKATGRSFQRRYAALPSDQRLTVSTHQVARGESLRSIARRFHLSASTLKKFNGLKSNRLVAGQKILLPVDAKVYLAQQKRFEARKAARLKRAEESGGRVYHTVRSGETPWQIAKLYDLRWQDVAQWNNISDVRRLRPGDKLVLYLDETPAKNTAAAKAPSDGIIVAAQHAPPNNHKVQSGDSVWKISRRYNVPPDQLRRMNHLKNDSLRPGQVLKVADTKEKQAVLSKASNASTPDSRTTAGLKEQVSDNNKKSKTYTVQQDDTLWKIARRHRLAPEEVRRINGLKNNHIRPGQVLKIAPPPSTPAKNAQADKEPDIQVISYQVKGGDTVWKIARLFNVRPDQIRAWNQMRTDVLRPGDVLTIKASRI